MSSISHRKIFEMFDVQMIRITDLNDRQKNRLAQLCKNIYTLEASNKNASRRNIEELVKEITLASDRIKALGEPS